MRTHSLPLLAALLAAPFTAHAQADTEPDNNNCSQFVDAITIEVANTAQLQTNADVDFFQVQVPTGGVLRATVGAVLNAAFTVQVWNANCQNIAGATGAVSQDANVEALVCAGLYYVRVARQSGTAPIDYAVTASLANSGECGSECNNTMATATQLASLDTTFQARLWGTHPGIAVNTNFNISQDQDFYRVETSNGSGLLHLLVTDIPTPLTLWVTCYEGTPSVYRSIGTFQRTCVNSTTNTGNVSGAWILEANKTYYLRFFDESTEGLQQCNNSYNMDPNCFTVNLSFDRNSCEPNNTFPTACTIPLDTAFQATLYGYNAQLTVGAGAEFENAQDQDFFKVHPDRGGVLTVAISNVPSDLRLEITFYNSARQVIRSTVNAGVHGNPVSSSALLCPGEDYYVRITEYDGCCTGPNATYQNSPVPYTMAFAFETVGNYDLCECNNTFATACDIPTDTTFQSRLHGVNQVIAAGEGTGFNYSQDMDFYRLAVTQGGTLSVNVSNAPSNMAILLTMFNEARQSIGGTGNPGHGGPNSSRWLLCPGTYYLRITEYDGCCTGDNATYNLNPNPFTLSLSFDTEDECECNNTFTTACEQAVGDSIQFKIFGRNTSNYYNANDRDFFKFTPSQCGTMNFRVVSIPPGFTIRTRLYSDTTNISSGIGGEVSATGPNPLSMDRPVIAGQTYYLMVRENSDAATNSQLMTGTIGLTPLPMYTATVTATDVSCAGATDGRVSVTDSGTGTTIDYNGEDPNALAPGQYTLTVADANGCSATYSYTIGEPAPLVVGITVTNATGPDDGSATATATGGTPPYTYAWSNGDTTPTATGLGQGVHTVVVTDSNGCSITETANVVNVSVAERDAASFSLRPNPTGGELTILLGTRTQARHITLLDATGRTVLAQPIANATGPLTLDLGGLVNGLYFVRVEFADGARLVERVVKE